jgi:hypothetical protein
MAQRAQAAPLPKEVARESLDARRATLPVNLISD